MDEFSTWTYVAADGTTTVTVIDQPELTLTIPADVPAIERDARIVEWVAARQAERA